MVVPVCRSESLLGCGGRVRVLGWRTTIGLLGDEMSRNRFRLYLPKAFESSGASGSSCGPYNQQNLLDQCRI